MLVPIALAGYGMGFALGMLAGIYLYHNTLLAMLIGFTLGGFTGIAGSIAVWMLVPPAFRNFLKASRTGFLIVALGADKKIRFLPGRTDGFVIRPVNKPYNERYVWAADGESAYPIHDGKGTQAIITYMGYPFPLEVRKAVAVTKFTERGFKSPEDLKTAVELPEPERLEREIQEVQSMINVVETMDEAQVQKQYGAGKEDLLNDLYAKLEQLNRIKVLVDKYGKNALNVDVDGGVVRARDLINYLLWRHHPAELERIIKAETNALLSRLGGLEWLKSWAPIIILGALAIIGLLAAIQFLTGGTATPQVLPNATQTVTTTIMHTPIGG